MNFLWGPITETGLYVISLHAFFVGNTALCLNLSVVQFQTNFVKKLVTPPLLKMHFHVKLHGVIKKSVYLEKKVTRKKTF